MNAVRKETSVLAVISLVAGILGWSLLPFLGSIGAVICGHVARSEIRKDPDTKTGDGFAVAGLILGWSAIIVGMLLLLAVLLLFGGIAAAIAWAAANGS